MDVQISKKTDNWNLSWIALKGKYPSNVFYIADMKATKVFSIDHGFLFYGKVTIIQRETLDAVLYCRYESNQNIF